MDFLSDTINLLKIPPYSTLAVIFISLCISIFSTVISRHFIDIDKLKRYTRETKEFNSMKMKAMRSQDRRLQKKVEDNQDRFNKMQKELMSMRLKPSLYTMVPLLAVFILFNTFFGANDAVVAIIPFKLPSSFIIIPLEHVRTAFSQFFPNIPQNFFVPSYIGWYFLTSITFGSVIQKLAGLTPD
ncbi:MAG: EMC3/TMCO1 family protein [Candidatus Thorarchaeota archaeon]